MHLVRWGASTSLAGVLAVLLVMSCQTVSPDEMMVLAGPLVPGAEYVGMEMCAECHEDQARRYQLTSHFGTSVAEGEEATGEACESCHGAGSLHVEEQGNPAKIVRYSSDRCFVCHVDKKAEFQLQYHHPVPEGRMECIDCHDPHGEDVKAWSKTSILGPGEKCFRCHKEMKGPYVFEHDALREGCQVCHNPHGAPYDKMLIADQTVVCLRCHWEVASNTTLAPFGAVTHGAGGLDGNYDIGAGEECVDHHRAPHGSNLWRTLNR